MDGREVRAWAREEFGGAQLGDRRRTARLVSMAATVASKPSGRVSSVFCRAAERQAAYDFVESVHVDEAAILESAVGACVERAGEYPFVFVPLDGTSLNLADHARTKDFGSIGSRERGARGLKVINAIAASPAGVPVGLAGMRLWARGPKPSRHKRRRVTEDKETRHWLDAVARVTAAFGDQPRGPRVWFQVDREGDAEALLHALAESGEWFTVRSNSERRLSTGDEHLTQRRRYLRAHLSRRKPVGYDLLEVPARDGRPSRLACLALRVARVVLKTRDKRLLRHKDLTVNVVWAREYGARATRSSRSGRSSYRALDWLLLTNHPVDTLEDARKVVFGYTQRWRVEDFHRAWKSGVCNVEDNQLRVRTHVIRWATVLAAVAIRAERLKHLSRERPTEPATVEFSALEIETLILLKRHYRKRTETITDDVPDLETATRWVAELGGYTGKSSGGPPGAITIRRGLDYLRPAAEALALSRASGKKR